MSDKSFLHWPFFEPRHRELADRLEVWAAQNLSGVEHDDTDKTCRSLVTALGRDGWLKFTAPAEGDAEKIDVRALALIREILARHSGLADFAFAMQGLGRAHLAVRRCGAAQSVAAEDPFRQGYRSVRIVGARIWI